jgi:hypothetical protein
VSLTHWEIYYAVYLATLESRDANSNPRALLFLATSFMQTFIRSRSIRPAIGRQIAFDCGAGL